MDEIKKIPVLRFPEFSGEWEVKTLGDVGEFKNGVNKSKEDFGFGKPFVNLMDVFGKTSISDTKLGLVNVNDKELEQYNLKKGDTIFIRSSVKREGVGETVVVLNDLNETVYSGFLIRFREVEEIKKLSLYFKKYCFHTKKFRNSLLSLSTTSANTNINQESLKLIKIDYPSLEEQKKIANFLTQIDSKIEQLSKKKQLLERYKKAMMQKLFSQQHRFKDDEGNDYPDWEEKMLGDVADIKTGNKDTQNKISNGKHPFFVRSQTVERINSFSYDGEAILTSGDGVGVGKNFHYINGKFDYHQRVYSITSFQDNICGKYVYIYFSAKFNKRVMRMSAKNSVDSVRMEMISKMPIDLPVFEEQTKIANHLTEIDKKIKTVDTQLNHSKQYKKGLLQQMFV